MISIDGGDGHVLNYVRVVIDIQMQHHVNSLSPGYWPRCRSVTIQDGRLHCRLDPQNLYSLDEAYSTQPHLLFLRMRTEGDLRDFTCRWGPLFYFDPDLTSDVSPVAWYWSRQHWLSALVKLVNAVRERHGERDALEKYVTADYEDQDVRFPEVKVPPTNAVMHLLPAASDLSAARIAIGNADVRAIREAASEVVRQASVLVCSAGFDVRSTRPRVVARWKIDSLDGALRWMVWRDEWRGQPLSYCAECHGVFSPKSKHRRKYCSQECGHRVAARKWAKDKRRKTRNQMPKRGS